MRDSAEFIWFSRRGFLFCAFSHSVIKRLLAAEDDTKFSTDVKVVNVFATVRDKQGQIIRNLSRDDFVLEEDGKPQTIRYFSRETDLPLTLGLLVDTSMSQRRVLADERSASYRFLDQVLREDKDEAFIIHVDREVELLQDLTSSRKKLEAVLALLETPAPRQFNGPGRSGPRGRGGGGTSLFDAVLLASDELMRKQSGRKALILLSDGVDNGSKVSLTEAIESAQRADTLAYSILFADAQAYGFGRGGFGGGPRMGRHGRPRGSVAGTGRSDGKKILQRISSETGGAFFEASHKQPITAVFDKIQEELRNQYSLGYVSDNTGGTPGFRKIRLTTNQKNAIVRTRDGYYAN